MTLPPSIQTRPSSEPRRDAQDAGVLGEALDLDQVHEALALDAAEAAVVRPLRQQRIDALAEEADFRGGGRFLCIKIDAGGVGAGAVLLIAQAGDGDRAQGRESGGGR